MAELTQATAVLEVTQNDVTIGGGVHKQGTLLPAGNVPAAVFDMIKAGMVAGVTAKPGDPTSLEQSRLLPQPIVVQREPITGRPLAVPGDPAPVRALGGSLEPQPIECLIPTPATVDSLAAMPNAQVSPVQGLTATVADVPLATDPTTTQQQLQQEGQSPLPPLPVDAARAEVDTAAKRSVKR